MLTAAIDFLRLNAIEEDWIVDFTSRYISGNGNKPNVLRFRRMLRAYEDMSMVMSTWYANPQFLDGFGQPLPLSESRGALSVKRLVRLSNVNISGAAAVALLHKSSSVKMVGSKKMIPIKRLFVLPGFEVPRAAFVMERFLSTLRENSSPNREETTLILERGCYVAKVSLRTLAPILKDIRARGSAFMDSVDGEIEGQRVRNSQLPTAEVGLFTFAWTKTNKSRNRRKVPAGIRRR